MVESELNRSGRSAAASSPRAAKQWADGVSWARRRRPRDRFFEALESRTLLSSTLFVTAPGTPPDATHFLTLQAALAAANTGDTIDLQSGFSPGTFITTSLSQPASAGNTSIHTAAALDVGDVITIGGTASERALVTAVTPDGSGDFLISLASSLLVSHASGNVDATNGAQGPTIGLSTGITLTADPGVTLPFNLEIWNTPASSMTTLSALDLGTHTLFIDGNASTISNSILGQVVVQPGAHANAFLGNTFNISSGSGFSLLQADGTILNANTFNVTSPSTSAVYVDNSQNVLILNNLIRIGSGASAIYVSADNGGSSSVDIRNNTLQTTDGFGVFLDKSDPTGNLQARLQGNDLRDNAVGVYILGDGTSAGNIDLGGGSTVFGTSSGGNNFSGLGTFDVDATHFTIGLFATSPAYFVRAAGNTFSSSNPLNLVADAFHIPEANGTGIILASGAFSFEFLNATPAPITVNNSAFSGTLATFTSNLSHVPSDFNAVIDWGDGSSSLAAIAGDDTSGYTVSGSHTWANAGTFSVTVILESNNGGTAVASTSAVVPPIVTRSLSLQGVNIHALQYDTFSGPVATFIDSQSATTPADYTASIAWSDGLTTPGTISANPDGSFSISTSRTFSTAGALTATVTLATSDHSLTASAPIAASVTARTLSLSGTNISLVQSATFTGILASFTDNKPGTAPSDYTASIAWSDGLTTPGTIIANPNGSFSISTSRVFPDAGTLSATVSVSTLAGLVSASTPITATVAPRTITLDAIDFTYPKNKLFTAVVATFTDNLPGTTASSYLVTVKWSDGLTTPATITQNKDGSFAISTSRSFSKTGAVIASITVTTTDNLFTGTASLTATITNKNDKLPPKPHHFVLLRLVKVCLPKPGGKPCSRK